MHFDLFSFSLDGNLKDFTSAFFFVFQSSPTSLKIANEKDSAFMSFEKHEITASNHQFESKKYLQS
jgi:hypothetical protein